MTSAAHQISVIQMARNVYNSSLVACAANIAVHVQTRIERLVTASADKGVPEIQLDTKLEYVSLPVPLCLDTSTLVAHYITTWLKEKGCIMFDEWPITTHCYHTGDAQVITVDIKGLFSLTPTPLTMDTSASLVAQVKSKVEYMNKRQREEDAQAVVGAAQKKARKE